MTIYGIGIDIANINRIKKSIKNKNFIKRIFNSNETMYEYFDAALCPKSLDEIKSLIETLKLGKELEKPKGQDKMLREIIYGGMEKFDVTQSYYEKISNDSLGFARD